MTTASRLPHYSITQGDEHLSSHSGLALIGQLLERSGFRQECNAVEEGASPQRCFHLGDLAIAMTGLICLGNPDFDSIEAHRKHPFFAQSLGLPGIPSSPTLRQRLLAAGSTLDNAITKTSQRMVRYFAPRFGGIKTLGGELIPLDIDVSVFDNTGSKKEGVSYTYHKNMGFAPIFCHIGNEGYLVAAELRPGSEHSQSEMTPAFLSRSIQGAAAMKQSSDHRSFVLRMDAGFDSKENLKICDNEGIKFIIARNQRRESNEFWCHLAQQQEPTSTPRPGKTVWIGSTIREVDGVQRRIVYEVIKRTSDFKNGTEQQLLIPTIEVRTFWTNLVDDEEHIFRWYKDRGTSEQFHSEMKTDLNLERLPSQAFDTNNMMLHLGMLAYNALRIIGQMSLQQDSDKKTPDISLRKKRVNRRRVRSVMDDLIRMAVRIIHTGRSWKLSFGRHCPWSQVWQYLYQNIRQLQITA